jgi:hypothetical protein
MQSKQKMTMLGHEYEIQDDTVDRYFNMIPINEGLNYDILEVEMPFNKHNGGSGRRLELNNVHRFLSPERKHQSNYKYVINLYRDVIEQLGVLYVLQEVLYSFNEENAFTTTNENNEVRQYTITDLSLVKIIVDGGFTSFMQDNLFNIYVYYGEDRIATYKIDVYKMQVNVIQLRNSNYVKNYVFLNYDNFLEEEIVHYFKTVMEKHCKDFETCIMTCAEDTVFNIKF